VVLSRRPFPCFSPPLTGLAGSLSKGEQIPQASVIMPPIPGNIHGASLKRSELM